MLTRRIPWVALTVLIASCAPGAVEPRQPAPAAVDAPVATTSATSPEASTTSIVEDPPAPRPEIQVIGGSVEGRPLRAATLGEGPVRVYVVGSIHGDERTAAETSRSLLEHLTARRPAAVTVRWLVDANPDGTADGLRDNARGVDLNRNWPTGHIPTDSHGLSPLSEPETKAVAADIEDFDPELIVALHSAREGPFVNYDGPGVALAGAFAAGATGDRVWEVLGALDWPTPGSLGGHFGARGVPVITVEGNRWDDPAAVVDELASGFDMLLAVAAGLPAPERVPECTDHVIGNACTDITRRGRDLLLEETIGGTSGFILKEAGGRVLAARWADHAFYPASSIKALHHLAVVRESGGSLTDPIAIPDDGCAGTGIVGTKPLATLDRLMMIESDNDAANALQAHFGVATLQQSARAAGMVDTILAHGFGCGGRSNDPANSTTAADLTMLYEHVATGGFLTPVEQDRFLYGMLDISARVAAELGRERLPTGIRVFAKDGWHPDGWSIGGVAQGPWGDLVFAGYVDRPRGYRNGFTIERLVAELLRDFIDV